MLVLCERSCFILGHVVAQWPAQLAYCQLFSHKVETGVKGRDQLCMQELLLQVRVLWM